jgi:DNA mismatch repair protein MutS2
MAIDPHTLELLEFAKVRELLAARATTAAGKRRALALAPGTDLAAARLSIQRIAEMADAQTVRAAPSLAGVRDIAAEVQRAALGVLLDPPPLLALRETLEAACRAREAGERLAAERPALGICARSCATDAS